MGPSDVHPGDSGESELLDGSRLPKDDPRFEALGAVDELSGALGVARAALAASGSGREAEKIRAVQRVLVKIGTEVASPEGKAAGGGTDRSEEADVAALDAWEQELERRAQHPGGFVLPGATLLEAELHVARAASRTAERRVVTCLRAGMPQLERPQRYLNRLSGCLFWLALCYGRDT